MSPIYLVVVELRGDADRKRLEYVLEKYSSEPSVQVRKLCAGTLLVDAEPGDMQRFVSDLLSRFSRDSVKVWLLSEPDFTVQPVVLERSFRVSEEFEDVWGVVNFVMSKYRGVLVSESVSGKSRVYRVHSKYGIVSVRFDLLEVKGKPRLLAVRVEGFGSAAPHVFEKLVREISYIEGGG